MSHWVAMALEGAREEEEMNVHLKKLNNGRYEFYCSRGVFEEAGEDYEWSIIIAEGATNIPIGKWTIRIGKLKSA